MNNVKVFVFIFFVFVLRFKSETLAQCACTPLNETFGSTASCGNPQNTTNLSLVNHVLRPYNGGTNDYPDDGEYAIRCNGSDVNWGWFGAGGTTISDHTTDVVGQSGYFALVNSGAGSREFYHRTVTGLCANTTYTLTYYAGNMVRDNTYGNQPSLEAYVFPTGTPVQICANKTTGGCVPTGGTLLGSTGAIPSEPSSSGFAWHTYAYNFTTGAGVTSVDVVLTSLFGMNAGFDFVFDDVMVTRVGGGCPLPIRLTSFTTEKTGEEVILKWSTVSEVNFRHFSVERSIDAIHFEEIGIVAGVGNSSSQQDYRFTDHSVVLRNSYYRLKLFDVDGTITYSEIKHVNFDGIGFARIYVTDEELIVQFIEDGEALCRIVDRLGISVYSSNRKAEESLIRIDRKDLTSGVYIIKLQMGTDVVIKKISLN